MFGLVDALAPVAFVSQKPPAPRILTPYQRAAQESVKLYGSGLEQISASWNPYFERIKLYLVL